MNAESCYEFRNHERRNSNLSPSLTALSLISPVGERERSLNVDGTTTRLMVDSFVNASTSSTRDQTMARSINTIFPTESVLAGLHSDTIIEHETSSSSQMASLRGSPLSLPIRSAKWFTAFLYLEQKR